MELTLDQALQKAVEAHKDGQIQEADRLYTAILKAYPKHPDANHNLGVLAVSIGKAQDALPFFKTALEINPSIAQFWISYIDALVKLDRPADAKAVFDQAKSKGIKGEAFDSLQKRLAKIEASSFVQDPPKYQIQSLINLYNQGQLQDAFQQSKLLITKFPKSAILFNIQGVLLKDLGQLDLSIEAYRKALALKSDYAEAHNNMGVTLQEQGKFKEAVEASQNALNITPDYAEALYNLGNALKEQGKLEESLEAYHKALAIKPDYPNAYYNIGVALIGVVFNQPNSFLLKTITSLLDKKLYVRPNEISPAAISLLKFDPNLRQNLQSSSESEVQLRLMEVIKDLSALPLLLKLMSVCPLPDVDLENLFRKLRACLLFSISELSSSTEILKFQSALALQCFTNEYIYNQSEHENEALRDLEVAVKQALGNGDQPSSGSILCLASYKPLYQYEWSKSLLITDEIEEVFIRQILEPNQEAQFKANLPVLEEITDKVSSKVRDQYEVSPYPRWVNLRLALKPMSISKVVREINLKLFKDQIKEIDAPNILIAGCGTGQHSIGTAARFEGSKVLAVDLSLASLGYAKRKTEELGIENIEYMQADILDLCKLGKQFDIVESSGVLHHMHEPLAGWKVLTDCLKPGGLMKIALYSELARQHIVEMRQEISKAGIGSSDAAMKSFRTTVIDSDQNHHKQILNSPDFYSLSTLKDLLFHVQEHRFTIPQIQTCLLELGLEFCGFDADQIVSNFRLANTEADDLYDLEKWQAYEVANPKAFVGMYQFWCQKIP